MTPGSAEEPSVPAGATRAGKVALDQVAPNRRRGGDIRTLLSPRTVGSTSGFMGVLYLKPGEHVAEHYHPFSEEFLYVVRGALVMRIEGEPVELAHADGLMIPVGLRHRLENRGREQAFVVFHLGPLAPRPELGHVDTEPLPAPAEPQPRVGSGR
jgi:putative monooxygenase